jgi:hypothetical protein
MSNQNLRNITVFNVDLESRTVLALDVLGRPISSVRIVQ